MKPIRPSRPERLFFAGLYLAVILSLILPFPVRAAADPSIPSPVPAQTGSHYAPRSAPSAVLSFSAPDIALAYGVSSANYSLTITNAGSLAAQSIRLYVDFGSVSVTATNAAYTTGADPYFTLADIAAGGSFTLDFTLGYTNWCSVSNLARSLVWQPVYEDSLGNSYTAGAKTSELTVANQPALAISLTGGPTVFHISDVGAYHLTSSYSGATSCASGSMGHVAVTVAIPNGFIVEDSGGGSWMPDSGGTGGVLTFSYTQPTTLNVNFSLRPTYSVTCGTTITVTATGNCTDCGTSVPQATASQTSASVCASTTLAGKNVTPQSCPRCGELTYTNTYTFPASTSSLLNDLIFTDIAENLQVYKINSLAVSIEGANIIGCVTMTDTTPGGTFTLDFSGCPAVNLASKHISIIYNMKTSAATGAPCTDLDFFSNSQLSGVGDIVYSAVPVHVAAPKVTAAISGLGSSVAVGETKTVTVTLTAENALTKDASFTLSKANYILPDAAATTCSGTVSPTACTPTSDASGYHWYFADGFDAAGKSAVIQMDVRKLATTDGDLIGTFNYDETCADDSTYDGVCSSTASASPALVNSGDVTVSIEPAVYTTSGKSIQWKTYVNNRGSGTATNVYVDHVLGAGLDYVSSTVDDMTGVTTTSDQDHTGAAIHGAVTSIASLAPGERREITFNVTRVAKTNLTYNATAGWMVNGSDVQTPAADSAVVDLLPLIVTNANDSGAGSLRQAIADADSGDTITFAGDYTIHLTSELNIQKDLTIDGTGHDITVDGGGASRVFYVGNVTVTLNYLTITNGYQSGGGGGLMLYNGTLNLLNSTVSGNISTDPTYSGGGIYNSSGTLNITNSTLAGNTAVNPGGSGDAGSGGAIHNEGGTVTIINSTIAGNHSSNASGGVSVGGIYSVGGMLSIQNVTVANNTAVATNGGSVVGGIYKSGSQATATSSIIAGNQSGVNCGGSLSLTGTNMEWGIGAASDSCTGFVKANPLLSALGDYGGPTQTMALLPGSSAINQGSGCAATDQRGVTRPQGAACDLGAFESRGFSLAVSGGNNQTTAINTSFANPLRVSVTSDYGEPVDGGQINFSSPGSGASAVLTGSPATISSGTASVTAAANGTFGSYAVSASTQGGSANVGFTLTNACLSAITVTNSADSGAGSLRQAIADVCAGGTIIFDPALAGQTVTLTSGQLEITKSMTIDGLNSSPGVSVSGNNAVRVFYISGGTVVLNRLNIQNGRNVPSLPSNVGGAGIFITNPGTNVTLNNSAVVNNATNATPTVGGGIVVDTAAALTMNNVTVSGNSSSFDAGGILNQGILNVNNSTITNNTTPGGGGGLETVTNTVFLRNTILAGNSGGSGQDCYTPLGFIQSAGYNLVGSTTNCIINTSTGDVTGFSYTALLMGPLQNNGGPTSTHALLPGSPAINAIPGCNGAPSTDQRGIARPQGPACDVGAYEILVPPQLSVNDVSDSEGNMGMTTFSFTVSLSSPAPVGGVTFDIATADNTATTANNDYLTHTLSAQTIPAGSSTYSFDVAVNGNRVVEADETFFVNITNVTGAIVTDGQGQGTITNDDTAGITVNPTTGLTTTEAGATATFTVVLTSQPTASVTLDLSSSDTTEGTASPASLTFTSANWSTPQTVTITGVDDLLADGAQAYTITTSAAVSTDTNYSGLDPADVSVSNSDDDAAGVTITPTSGLTTTEAGGTASFTIVLNSMPANTVTLPLASSDTSEGTIPLTSLTFTHANWNVPQPITVTGVDDLLADGDVGYTIQTGAVTSADLTYDGINPADVSLLNSDDDSRAASLATDIHNPTHAVIASALVGDLVHASVTVTGNGALTPGGNVTFSIYPNVSCSGSSLSTETAALSPTGTADMISSAALTADGLSFRVHYNGDGTYPSADGACTAISTNSYPTVLELSANTVPYDGQTLTAGINRIMVQFNMDVFHASPSAAHSAANPANYLLIGPGANATFDTSATTGCLSGVSSDDASYAISSVSYDAATFVATLQINGGSVLPVGQYRLYVCGSTSITNLAEDVELNNGLDTAIEFAITRTANSGGSNKSVATGFEPGVVTGLPTQPADLAYSASDLWIEIPALGIHQPIVGVPQTDAGWDVTWLADEIGYLQGTAFPTWAGNSVLTGHVTGADGLAGVFADLGRLKWGQEIIIHAFGQKYVYEVRTVDQTASPDTSKVVGKHEDLPWLTLITCRGYDEKTGEYRYRTVVRAVQVRVE